MRHTRDCFWILLIMNFYCLNLSFNINVGNTSLISTNLTIIMQSSASTNVTTEQTLNYTNTGNNNTLYMLKLSEAVEKSIDFDVLKKIHFYNNLATGIWRIFPPILLGKK